MSQLAVKEVLSVLYYLLSMEMEVTNKDGKKKLDNTFIKVIKVMEVTLLVYILKEQLKQMVNQDGILEPKVVYKIALQILVHATTKLMKWLSLAKL